MRLLLLLSLQAAAALQLPGRAPTANRAPTVQMGAEPFDPRIEELIGEHKVGRRLPAACRLGASEPHHTGPCAARAWPSDGRAAALTLALHPYIYI